jgi:hypothetical protein
MLLLHISDIHFREPDCVNPDLDPDRPYRTRMIQDVRRRVQTIGPVGALLVGGDVAFKGHPTEALVGFRGVGLQGSDWRFRQASDVIKAAG